MWNGSELATLSYRVAREITVLDIFHEKYYLLPVRSACRLEQLTIDRTYRYSQDTHNGNRFSSCSSTRCAGEGAVTSTARGIAANDEAERRKKAMVVAA